MKMKAKDERIMAALLSCGTVAEAARMAGVSKPVVYNRLADNEFKAEYDRLRTVALNEACNKLQTALTEAVDTIKEIMKDTSAAQQIRLNAAALILQNSLKYTEQIEILKRLEKVEEITNNNK